MTSADGGPVTVLDEQRCWELVGAQQIGRLATSVDRIPDIFPVNYVVDGRSIVFRTAEGSKLFGLTINKDVAFEVDSWDATEGWSVVLRGKAEPITSYDDVLRAEALPLRPWVPTVKLHYVRISITHVSGRGFAFGPEPEPDYTL